MKNHWARDATYDDALAPSARIQSGGTVRARRDRSPTVIRLSGYHRYARARARASLLVARAPPCVRRTVARVYVLLRTTNCRRTSLSISLSLVSIARARRNGRRTRSARAAARRVASRRAIDLRSIDRSIDVVRVVRARTGGRATRFASRSLRSLRQTSVSSSLLPSVARHPAAAQQRSRVLRQQRARMGDTTRVESRERARR